ncbi:MAG: ATP-binding cassette domain-containing protein [Cardiobacteriaceae bacterium]|nr:ATP-binding cassette domain-containing protein [Cardiobacteriaceae bacterium]
MTTPTVPSLLLEHVNFTYPNGLRAIDDVSFSLTGGTVCALVGVNGSGKSTLFNAIMGILRPQAGRILINGLPVASALKQNAIAYVPQSEQIDWHFPIRVRDVVLLGRYGHMNFLRHARAQDYAKVDGALARLGIADLADRQIGALSGGQKKRVFLARALAQESRVILLDEPFTGVDISTEQAVMALLQELRDQGYLMLVSTHNLGAVPQFCNEVVLLRHRIIAVGDMVTTYTRDNLERAFGGRLKNIYLGDEQMPELTLVSDDEHPAVFYGDSKHSPAHGAGENMP